MSEKPLIKVNLGCGETKLEGFTNIDVEEAVKPDLVHDIRRAPFPFDDESVEEFYCIHNIEHIEFQHWARLFVEIWRILIPSGKLVLAYPEFEKCSKAFLENTRGNRDFFRMTLYGRQLYPGDYHVTPVVSTLLVQYLRGWGFTNIKYGPEGEQDHYTMLKAEKGELISRQEAFKRAMTGVKNGWGLNAFF